MWELTAWEYWPVLVVCIAASTPVVPWAWGRIRTWAEGGQPSPVTAEGRTAHIKTIEARELCSTQCQPASASRARAVALVETLADLALLALLVVSIASVLTGTYNPFIYFQF